MTDSSSTRGLGVDDGANPTGVRAQPRRTWRATLDGLTNVLMCLAAVAVLWSVGRQYLAGSRASAATPREIPVPTEPQSLDGAQVMGNPSAPLVVIEYTDLKCPYCGKFARETLPAFERDYVATGKVRFALRNLPLEQLHPEAFGAAVAAACAGQQGKFWAFHDAVFHDQEHLDPVALQEHARELGLDAAKFENCLTDPSIEDAVRRDEAAAAALHLAGTPIFLVGRPTADGRIRVERVVRGFQSESGFAQAVGLPSTRGPAGQ